MARKLYIGGLSYRTTEESLEGLFSEVGNVDSVAIINDRDTGRSKGFGFIEMSTDDDAGLAIERFNGTDFDGRTLTVNEAKPRAPREGRSDGYRASERW